MTREIFATCMLVVTAIAAGCVGGDAPAGDVAAPGEVDATEGGRIVGLVTSDEHVPIPDAVVGIVELNLTATTGADGGFDLAGVPVGTHALAVQALGYESHAQRVTLAEGGVLEIHVALARLAVADPYYEMHPHRLLHNWGQTYLSWAINLTGQAPMCEGCVWTIHASRSPDFMLVEIFGDHTFQKPTGDAQEYFWSFQNCYSGEGCGPIVMEDYYPLPAYAIANRTHGEGIQDRAEGIGDAQVFWNQITCEFYWICFQESRDVWITLFHEMEVPDDFTARPDE